MDVSYYRGIYIDPDAIGTSTIGCARVPAREGLHLRSSDFCTQDWMLLKSFLRPQHLRLPVCRTAAPLRSSFLHTTSAAMGLESIKVATTADFTKDGAEMKEVAFKDDAKILISKVDGQYYATGSKWCVGSVLLLAESHAVLAINRSAEPGVFQQRILTRAL